MAATADANQKMAQHALVLTRTLDAPHALAQSLAGGRSS